MTRRSAARVTPPYWVLLVVLVLSLFISAAARAQDRFNGMGATTNTMTSYDSWAEGTALIVTVYAENNKKRLDRQSVIRLLNPVTQIVKWQTTNDQSEATIGSVAQGHYDVEASAVGYITTHQEVPIIGNLNRIQIEMILHRDPEALDLGFANGAMPPKVRKQTKRAVSALKSGNLDQAQKWLGAAYQAAPANPDLNFLMGYLNYQQKDFGHAQTYLGRAAELNPHDVQSLTLLGRLGLQNEDYISASLTLEKAVVADSDYWMAHNLLADAYLKQRKYEGARNQARRRFIRMPARREGPTKRKRSRPLRTVPRAAKPRPPLSGRQPTALQCGRSFLKRSIERPTPA